MGGREGAVIRRGMMAHQTLDEAFPVVDPLCKPLGNAVLVQMRRPKLKTAGGIEIPIESQDWDASMLRVGKVLSMGPIAYKKRDSMEPWPEGAWVRIGDYVRTPMHAGIDGWKIFINDVDWVQFSQFNDYDLKNLITGNPLDIIDYV